MIIPAKGLPKYLDAITFPVPIYQPVGDTVAFSVNRAQLEELIHMRAVFGVGTYRRIRRVRLYEEAYKTVVLRMKYRPTAEDSKLSFLAGRTWLLHLKRSDAYSPEARKEWT